MKYLLLFFAIVLNSGSCARTDNVSGITRVWALDDGEKIKQDDLNHWAATSSYNTVWDGSSVKVFGARNEVVAFQVILEARGSGARNVDVKFDSLNDGVHVITNTGGLGDPFNFIGKHIELFTESYINVEQRGRWWLYSSRPLPDAVHTGWIPDALVPFEVTGTFDHGTGGAPFDIEPGKNQGVWVDIYIPRDAEAGTYKGVINVIENGTTTFRIPVSLDVEDFTLPDQTHLHNHFFWGLEAITVRHGYEDDTPEYWKLYHAYANVFHRHRLDLIDGARTLDAFKVHLAGYHTGEYYGSSYRYEGPGFKTGNGTYSVGTYDQPNDGWRSGFWPDSMIAWQSAADKWEEWFLDNAPGVVRFKYMEDEPPYGDWPDVRKKASWIRSSTGVGKDLAVLLTSRISPELYGYVTFWMTEGHAGWPDTGGTTGYDIPVVRARRSVGEKVGFYNGQRPSYGEPISLDNYATDARVNPWIAWKYNADQYFLWEVAFYASTDLNIWTQGYTGSLIYTGTDVKYPGDSRNIQGPITSIRMKNLRRGFQDYEYLWLAREAGIAIADIVNNIVPAAFNDYNGSTFTSQRDQPLWADKGHVFENARKQLARLLSKKRDIGSSATQATGEIFLAHSTTGN